MFLDIKEIETQPALKRHLVRLLHRGIILFVVSMALIAQTGCVGPDGQETGPATEAANGDENLVLRITDAPFPFDSIARADVRLTSVLAHVQGSGQNRFFQLTQEEVNINLLDLRGGLSKVLVKTRVPNGTIRQLRLMVAAAKITLKDGRVFDLTIPSGDASGLKVYIDPPLEIRTGAVSELMLDFDVSKSFVVQGNPETPAGIKGFHFKPVVRVGNSSVHGTISGEVYSDNCTPADVTDDMPLDGATVSAAPETGESAMTGTGTAGQFVIFGLAEGLYDLVAEAASHDPRTVESISVFRANNSSVGRITLAKHCTDDDDGSDGEDGSDDGDTGDGDTGGGDTGGGDTGGGDTGGGDTEVVPIEWSVMGFDATSQATSMQIFWQSAVPTAGTVYLGLTPDALSYRIIDISAYANTHVVFLEDLAPGTTYFLKVVARDETGLLHESVVIEKATKNP